MELWRSWWSWAVFVTVIFVGAELLWGRGRLWRLKTLSDVGNWAAYYGGFHLVTWFTAVVISQPLTQWLRASGHARAVGSLQWLYHQPLWLQALVLVVVIDFVKYWVHRLLHAVPSLWLFHRVHHSIRTDEMHALAGPRVHLIETLVYRLLLYVPLLIFLVKPPVVFIEGLITLGVAYFTHADLTLGRRGWWRYVLNSPHMHRWHHAYDLPEGRTVNFGTLFSVWDWLFGTAHVPWDEPARLGFAGEENMHNHVLGHQLYPLWRPAERKTEHA